MTRIGGITRRLAAGPLAAAIIAVAGLGLAGLGGCSSLLTDPPRKLYRLTPQPPSKNPRSMSYQRSSNSRFHMTS